MLRRETIFREALFGDVLDRQQNDGGRAGLVDHQSRVHPHDLAPDTGKDMIDVDVVYFDFGGEPLAERAKRGNIPLAVAELEQHFANRLVRTHPKRSKERAIGLRDAKVRVEDEEGLADRVEDVEQQPVGRGGTTGDEARTSASDHCGVFHVVQAKKRDDRRQSHDRSSRPTPSPEARGVCGERRQGTFKRNATLRLFPDPGGMIG